MKYNIVEKRLYSKSVKKLSKTYKNIKKDVDNFLTNISSKEDLGIELKSNIYKARIANSDKNKGKSAGYRLISYLAIIENELQLLYIYDKSSLVNLTEKELDEIIIKQITQD
jgi:mRNA-degrading endonuclease RelE of RelBE toxin-antitoxin system